MPKKMKTRKGTDGYNYPYTHDDLIFSSDSVPLSQRLNKILASIEELDRLTKKDLVYLEYLILSRTGSKNEPADDDIPIIYLSDGFLPTTKDYTKFGYIYDFKQVQIGSTEGVGRSTASGYHIEIKSK